MHVEFAAIYLKIMAQCSTLELMSCNLSEARPSDFCNGCEVQLSFEFVRLMKWKIALVLSTVHTDEAHNDQCVFFTRLHNWYSTSHPMALILIVVHDMLILQDLQLT